MPSDAESEVTVPTDDEDDEKLLAAMLAEESVEAAKLLKRKKRKQVAHFLYIISYLFFYITYMFV